MLDNGLFMNTNLFLSTHINRIDGKGRVSFPAPFRLALTARNSQGVALYPSLSEPAIEGITLERLQQMAAALERLPTNDPARIRFQRRIFGSSHDLQIDKEGRCSLPKSLLDKLGIDGAPGAEIAFVGLGSSFQIWEPKALDRDTAELEEAVTAGLTPFPILPEGVL
jgi:MraZ protein